MRGTPENLPLAGNPFISVPLLFLAMIFPSSMVMISSKPSRSKSPNDRDESDEMREIGAVSGELLFTIYPNGILYSKWPVPIVSNQKYWLSVM